MAVQKNALTNKNVENCRVCLSERTKRLISYGKQPNSFELLKFENQKSYTHEMSLGYCLDCGFVFITDPIPPEKLYTEYLWPTSLNPASHLGWLFRKINDFLKDDKQLILDIGSNDGYFLGLFKKGGHDNVLGIEPAKDCAEKAALMGINTINDYLNEPVIDYIKTYYRLPKVIICRHVIEHVLDLENFIKNIHALMGKDTLLVLETPSFEMISQKGDFSCIWEQHINYFSLHTLTKILGRYNLSLRRHYIFPFGGGSLLLFIQLGWKNETDNSSPGLAQDYINKSEANIKELNTYLKNLKSKKYKITAFGAGHRSTLLLNISGGYKYIDYVVDDNKNKEGLFLPGSRLPIFNTSKLYQECPPHYCLLTPLNSKKIEKKVINRHSKFTETGGKFIELFPGNFRSTQFINYGKE